MVYIEYNSVYNKLLYVMNVYVVDRILELYRKCYRVLGLLLVMSLIW